VQRRKFVRWLGQHGAVFVRHGGDHDWWHGPQGGQAPVPRHKEINANTARKICDQLGLPRAPGR
jgi:predicted RNA binding protein YcfA (HicA-like mRNA interferase family)